MVPAILTGSKLRRTAAAGLLALAIGGGAATAVAATTDESLRGPDVTIIAEKESETSDRRDTDHVPPPGAKWTGEYRC